MFDALTGALSRYAYNIKLKEYKDKGICPDNLAVYVIDINGLKKGNDRYGHEYGDDLICGAVSCIKETFDGIGECYRTGGDEFVVFSEINKEQAEERQNALSVSSKKWQGKLAKNLRLAIGYVMAEDYKKSSIEELVIKADELMYEAKQRYYVEHEIRKKRNNQE
jgi:diguanylate cyclase (GGDEF)-like protein